MSRFITRSEREAMRARKTTDSERANIQNINQANKDFWEQKKMEEKDRLAVVNRHLFPYGKY
ncbi:hypothetical protein NMD10_09415 [Citrobacter portucalensis]|uniref:hypothetical protein n=1 Tax=Citrobacter portucalensis TaxID=1639133 RepID=UPI00351D4DE0